MKRYVRCSAEDISAQIETMYSKLNKAVELGEIPADGSVIKCKDDYAGTSYWKVEWTVDDMEIEDAIAEYGVDNAFEYLVASQIWLNELPEEEFGGMAFGDVTSWEPSSLEEAENDNYGEDE